MTLQRLRVHGKVSAKTKLYMTEIAEPGKDRAQLGQDRPQQHQDKAQQGQDAVHVEVKLDKKRTKVYKVL